LEYQQTIKRFLIHFVFAIMLQPASDNSLDEYESFNNEGSNGGPAYSRSSFVHPLMIKADSSEQETGSIIFLLKT
jgi:hypothetical protein